MICSLELILSINYHNSSFPLCVVSTLDVLLYWIGLLRQCYENNDHLRLVITYIKKVNDFSKLTMMFITFSSLGSRIIYINIFIRKGFLSMFKIIFNSIFYFIKVINYNYIVVNVNYLCIPKASS